MAKDQASHGHFLLLLRVSGASATRIEQLTQEIHDSYMKEYGQAGAITVALHKLLDLVKQGTNTTGTETMQWEYAVRYFGPTGSVGGLQQRLETAAKDAGAKVQTQTYRVTDLTGKY